MPDLNVTFHLTDAQFTMLEGLRDKIDRDEVLRLCLDMGLSDFFDDCTRMHKDSLYQTMQAMTKNYEKGRGLRRVTLPDAAADEPELFDAVRSFNKAK